MEDMEAKDLRPREQYYMRTVEELFTPEDWANLRRLSKALTDDEVKQLGQEFLSELLSLEGARELINSKLRAPSDVNWLSERIFKFLRTYLEVPTIEGYLESLDKVSEAHYRANVDPRTFLLGYSKFQNILLEKLKEKRLDEDEMLRALFKRSILELTVILDTYWRKILERLLWTERRTLIDNLTKLYNRRFLDIELPSKLKGEFSSYSVVMIDLDDFKKVNDTYGHLIGDALLRAFAKELTRSFKGKDFIIRYGGDEFIVVLTDVHKRLAQKLMNRLKEEIKGLKLPDNTLIPIKFSWGIAEYPKDSEELVELIRIADRRMYHNKRRKKRRGDQS